MPRLTLQRKVFLALAVLLVLLLLIFAGFSRLGLQRGLGPYVAEIELSRMDWLARRLAAHHASQGGWDALRGAADTDAAAWHLLLRDNFDGRGPGGGPGAGPRPPPDGGPGPWREGAGGPGGPGGGPAPPFDMRPPRHLPPPPPPNRIDSLRERPDSIYDRLELLDAKGQHVAGAAVDAAAAVRRPLREGATLIGQLVLAPPQGLGSDADRAFLAQQSRFVLWTGLAGLGLALLLSWMLARRWFAPIADLMTGAHDIAHGRFAARVPVRGRDELATLSRSFNAMARQLDEAEGLRRAWLADVAHELRTPLAAMRAEIEALQDGVRPFDDKTALRLHRQVMRLGQLVDDLRLSMDDGTVSLGARELVRPVLLLREACSAMRERFAAASLALDVSGLDALGPDAAPAGAAVVLGDPRRLHQVFMNLLENSLRYTDAGGQLRIGASRKGSGEAAELWLVFDDSAPGVPSQERPRIFERLYRGEASRSRAHGGSGLGLAICSSIVRAHGGRIEADASPLGGLRVTVALPLEEER